MLKDGDNLQNFLVTYVDVVRTGKAVSAPPHEGDPLLSTTVLPYLEHLHYPSPDTSQLISQPGDAGDQEMRVETSGDHRPSSAPGTQFENRLVRQKSKTTSCIKLKNGCKTQ